MRSLMEADARFTNAIKNDAFIAAKKLAFPPEKTTLI
jgi:hypothetical protein